MVHKQVDQGLRHTNEDAMNNEATLKAIDEKIGKLSINATIDVLKMAMENYFPGSDIVITRILASLESRMEESAFVALCESI